jgi:hypothetical protein
MAKYIYMATGTYRKQQLPFVWCKGKKEMADFRLFAANGNRKRCLFSL